MAPHIIKRIGKPHPLPHPFNDTNMCLCIDNVPEPSGQVRARGHDLSDGSALRMEPTTGGEYIVREPEVTTPL